MDAQEHFFDHVAQGYMDSVRLALESSEFSIFTRQRFSKRTALHIAICHKQFAMAQFLHDKGADIHALDFAKNNCLLLACSVNDLALVQWCVQKGAQLVCKNAQLQHALHVTSQYDIVHYLLSEEHDLAVNVVDEHHFTPFLYACQRGALATAQLLYQKHAKMILSLPDGTSYLHMAAQVCHTAMVQWIVTLDSNATNRAMKKHNLRAIHISAMKGDMASVQLMLDHCANRQQLISAKTSEFCTVLHCAIVHIANEQLCLQCVNFLIAQGAPLKEQYQGRNAFMWACRHNLLSVVKRLAAEHAYAMDSYDAQGATAFLLACQFGTPDMIDFLLQHCACNLLQHEKHKPEHNALYYANQNLPNAQHLLVLHDSFGENLRQLASYAASNVLFPLKQAQKRILVNKHPIFVYSLASMRKSLMVQQVANRFDNFGAHSQVVTMGKTVVRWYSQLHPDTKYRVQHTSYAQLRPHAFCDVVILV